MTDEPDFQEDNVKIWRVKKVHPPTSEPVIFTYDKIENTLIGFNHIKNHDDNIILSYKLKDGECLYLKWMTDMSLEDMEQANKICDMLHDLSDTLDLAMTDMMDTFEVQARAIRSGSV